MTLSRTAGGAWPFWSRPLLAMLLVAASPGCSLVFTQVPRPEARPPVECTASVAAPVADTVFATASWTLFGVGVYGAATSCAGGGDSFCGLGQAAGWGAIILGTVMGALFTTSAVVGYQRTSACRASLPPAPQPPPEPPGPPKSLLQHGSAEGCHRTGDAPRVCPSMSLHSPGAVPLAVPR